MECCEERLQQQGRIRIVKGPQVQEDHAFANPGENGNRAATKPGGQGLRASRRSQGDGPTLDFETGKRSATHGYAVRDHLEFEGQVPRPGLLPELAGEVASARLVLVGRHEKAAQNRQFLPGSARKGGTEGPVESRQAHLV